MRNNAKNGTEPYQPEQTIQIMREAVPAAAGVGAPPAFLVALPIILKAIAAAIAATVSLIAMVKAEKQAQLRAAAQGIGTQGFGPERTDWMGASAAPGGVSPGGAGDLITQATQSPLLPLLAVGAGLFLLRD